MINDFHNKKEARKTIQSVDRALRILEEIAAAQRPMSLKDLSSRLDLNIATAHHILGTLVARGFVVQEPYSRRYKLGLKLLEFSKAALDGLEFREEIRPFLVNLMEQTGETINLVIFDGNEAVYIDQVQSRRASMFRMFTSVGTRVPLHCTGVGKVYLAYLSKDNLNLVLGKGDFTAFTSRTITTMDELASELDRVRRFGYAVDNEEREEGVRCVAAPLMGRDGTVVAAVSVSGPASRITEERIGSIASALLNTTRAISDALGFLLESQESGEY